MLLCATKVRPSATVWNRDENSWKDPFILLQDLNTMKMRLTLPFQLRLPFSKPAPVAMNKWCVMYDAQNTPARTGSSPSGTMMAELISTNTIQITYDIPSGIQTFYHDNPGRVYTGTTRVAYLLNNDEGRQLLTRLKYAWQHGLIFDVGTSLTTVSRFVFIYRCVCCGRTPNLQPELIPSHFLYVHFRASAMW
jgi:hypothetical protein